MPACRSSRPPPPRRARLSGSVPAGRSFRRTLLQHWWWIVREEVASKLMYIGTALRCTATPSTATRGTPTSARHWRTQPTATGADRRRLHAANAVCRPTTTHAAQTLCCCLFFAPSPPVPHRVPWQQQNERRRRCQSRLQLQSILRTLLHL